HALREPVLARPPDVVHDLVVPILFDGPADARRDVLQCFIPADLHPLPLAPPPRALQRLEDAVGVGDLVQRCRSLCAVAAARAGVLGVALELADLERRLVDVGEEAAGGFAVEAGRGDEDVALLDTAGPRLRVQLDPVVPALLRREGREVDAGRAGVEGLAAGFGTGAGGGEAGFEFVQIHSGSGYQAWREVC